MTIKLITSITAWNDAVGKRLSITYSEVDEADGRVISDNKRIDRVIVDTARKELIDDLLSIGQEFVDTDTTQA